MINTDYRPSMTLDIAINKAQMIADIRQFFGNRGVLEITTPILSNHGNTDIFIESVSANFKQYGKLKTGYLHTSPEFAMKRVLAEYQIPIYQICQVFRDNEKGDKHNIEFTMLEWYRPDFNLADLANELNALISVALHKNLPFKTYRYAQAFNDRLGIHPFCADIDTLQQVALAQGIHLNMGNDRQGWLDLLFSHVIEPTLGHDLPTLITDYPVATASLAKVTSDVDGYDVAKRFELYINGIEIANAYDELTSGDELFKRFTQDNHEREKLGLPVIPIDMNLIRACDDLPPCSGIALGIDRLFMVREKLFDISQAIMMMTDRA